MRTGNADARVPALKDDLRVRVLGPIRAIVGGAEETLGGTKQRTMLAALVLAKGRLLSDAQMSRLLWDCDPPNTAGAQIHTYASRLRKHLGPGVPIARVQSGYRIDMSQVHCDHVEFDELARAGRVALDGGQWARASELLGRALDLWDGDALADGTKWLAAIEGPVWEERRRAAHESRIEADLALGRHRELIAELSGLVAAFPFQERLRAQLMVALSRSARQAEAVSLFNDGRRLLVEELGIDPSPVLTNTYQEILRGTTAQEPDRAGTVGRRFGSG